eukprot:5217888-Pyramimonas_sp.AAC.1
MCDARVVNRRWPGVGGDRGESNSARSRVVSMRGERCPTGGGGRRHLTGATIGRKRGRRPGERDGSQLMGGAVP